MHWNIWMKLTGSGGRGQGRHYLGRESASKVICCLPHVKTFRAYITPNPFSVQLSDLPSNRQLNNANIAVKRRVLNLVKRHRNLQIRQFLENSFCNQRPCQSAITSCRAAHIASTISLLRSQLILKTTKKEIELTKNSLQLRLR